MQTIIATFADGTRVQGAVRALLERNFDAADIHYVAEDIQSGAVPQADATATSGAAGTVGLLAGAGALAIPYVGPLLAAAPILAGLAGAGAGAALQEVDRLGQALADIGVPEAAARGYGASVRGGKALVLVRAREVVGDDIAAILRDSGAETVARHPRKDD